MKILLALLLLAPLAACSGQALGPGYSGGCSGATCVIGVSFSPAPGTYVGPQSVSIISPAGTECHYTTDGSTPNLASTKYTAPLTVSTSQTIKTECAIAFSLQNVQACGSGGSCKCITFSGGTFGGLTCQAGGGVGSINPSNVAWTKAATAAITLSTTSATGSTQALFIWTSASGICSNCTMLAHDVVFQPDQGSTFLLNNELDSNYTLPAFSHQQHSASLQCNQQGGTLQWQVDDQQGPWYNTGFTFGCPNSTTNKTTARLTMHWVNGDASCTGSFSCDHYDRLTVCVEGTGCQDKDLSVVDWGFGPGILPGYREPSWPNIVVAQHQPDLTNTTTSGSNPTTSIRTVYQDNATVGYYSTLVDGTASYTIN